MHQAPMLEMSLAAEQLALKIWAQLFCVQIQTSRRFDWNQVGLNNRKIWKIREKSSGLRTQGPGIKLWRVCRGLSIAGGVSATSYPSMDQGPNHVIARDVNGKRLPCFGMRSRGSVLACKNIHTYIVGLKTQTRQFAAACSQTAWWYQTKLRIGFS